MSVQRLHFTLINFSILIFTGVLVWFAFIYYPKIINQYKSGSVPSRPLVKSAVAYEKKFPVETKYYRIVFEDRSNTYYVFVSGVNVDQFVSNKQSAELALKNALSMESLCNLNVIYAPQQGLKVPDKFKVSSDCK